MSGYKRKKYPQSSRKNKKRKRKQLIFALAALAAVLLIIACVTRNSTSQYARGQNVELSKIDTDRPAMDVELLTVNPYSRPGTALTKVKGVVIHYTANAGSTAIANRNYFEGLKDSHTTKASSHFIVGLDGEIVQCIPTAEISYASNNRNKDTISIECCYKNEDGSFEQQTYDSVIQLTAWLCKKFGLTSKDVIRHYDVTGKLCPLYYVQHEDAWKQFRKDVDRYLKEYQKK